MTVQLGQPAPSFTVRATTRDDLTTEDLTRDTVAVLAFAHFAFSGG